MATIRHNTGSGNWDDKHTWDPRGVPSVTNIVKLDLQGASATVTLTGSGTASSVEIGDRQALSLVDANLVAAVQVHQGGRLQASIGSSTVTSVWVRDSKASVVISDGTSLTVNGTIKNAGDVSLSSSGKETKLQFGSSIAFSSVLTRSSLDYEYAGGTISLSDSANNIIAPAGERGNIVNVNNTIQGAGQLGAGNASVDNRAALGDGTENGDHAQGVIRATGINNALVIDTGPNGTLKNGGVIQGLGKAGLIIGNADLKLDASNVLNTGSIDAGPGSKAVLAHVVVTQTRISSTNSGAIRAADKGAELDLQDTTITGGTVSTETGSLMVAAGKNVLTNVTLTSAGSLTVGSGASLTLNGGTASIAALDDAGAITFDTAMTLKGGGAVSIAGSLTGSGAGVTLTNVDEAISGAGSIKVAILSNQSAGKINDVALDIGTLANDGKIGDVTITAQSLTNRGTISGATIHSAEVANNGSIADTTFDVPYGNAGKFVNGKNGIITNATFGMTIVANHGGLIQADGAGRKVLLSGTEILDGSLSTSNGGVIEVQRFDSHVTSLSPESIAAGTHFLIDNGAYALLANTWFPSMALDNVTITLAGAGNATTLNMLGGALVLQGGGKITLSDSMMNKVEIGGFTNADGTISGAGTIEFSSLDNQASAKLVANGASPLTINVLHLKNNGMLEADGGTLKIVSSDIVQGGGAALVSHGGTVDLSKAAGYLGNLVYAGAGTILGSISVPATKISGFATGDRFIFGKQDAFGAPLTTSWQQNGADGTLTIKTSPTETYATLQFAGVYDNSDFTVSQVSLSDGSHVAVTFSGALRWAEAVNGNWQTPTAWNPSRLYAPRENDNALITATGAAYTVTVDHDTVVKSMATGSDATVDIKGSTLVTTTGTASVANAGTVKVEAGAAFVVGGTFRQAATGDVVAAGPAALIDLDEGATISGGRITVVEGGVLNAANGPAKLEGVAIANDGLISIEDYTTLVLINSAVSGAGEIEVGMGSTLAVAGSTFAGNTIEVMGELQIDADSTLDTSVNLASGGIVGNLANGVTVKLDNAGAITGSGQIGNKFLSLVNDGSIIAEAGEEGNTIWFDTGANTVVNNGYIAASAGGAITFSSAIDNIFAIYAAGGGVEFGAAVTNRGLMSASDADSTLTFKGALDNAGSISITGGGVMDVQGAITQQESGRLLASGEGSTLKLNRGSGISGGEISLADQATLEVESGDSASVTLRNTDLSLDATIEVSVFKSTLNLVDSEVDSDGSVTVNFAGSALGLAGATTLHGGTYNIEQAAVVRVSGKEVVLDDTTFYMGTITRVVSEGKDAMLTNGGRILGGTATIGDAHLTLHNEGFISTNLASDVFSIITGDNKVVNDGTITAREKGAVMSITGGVENTSSGMLLSGKGTLTATDVDNAGLISAGAGGKVEVWDTLRNTGEATAEKGGVLEASSFDNSGKVFATGVGSKITIGHSSVVSPTNAGQIIADDKGTVTLNGNVNNVSGGQLIAQAEGRINVVGAAFGGIATLTDGGIVDFRGDAFRTTTTNAVFVGTTVEHLLLGNSVRFAGSVTGMGKGDTIDVTDIAYAASESFYDANTKQLNISDGTAVVKIQLIGTYAAGDFTFASDGHGGTLVTDMSAALQSPAMPNESVTPVATNDAYIVVQGQAFAAGAEASLLLNDANATAATLKTGPAHGALVLADDGSFSYTPAPGYAGIDSFSYQAGNGSGAADGQVVLYVVPTQGTTLNLTALDGESQVAALYTAFFGRGADEAGFAFWMNELATGAPTHGPAALLADIASTFAISDEAKALYAFLANPHGANDSQIGAFLDTVYGNLFNRAPDAAGRTYWTMQVEKTLAAGGFVGEVLADIMSGAQDSAAGKDITTLMGKVAVGLEYVHQQELHGTAWAGAADAAAATALLHAVTSDPASVLVGLKNAELLIANHA